MYILQSENDLKQAYENIDNVEIISEEQKLESKNVKIGGNVNIGKNVFINGKSASDILYKTKDTKIKIEGSEYELLGSRDHENRWEINEITEEHLKILENGEGIEITKN